MKASKSEHCSEPLARVHLIENQLCPQLSPNPFQSLNSSRPLQSFCEMKPGSVMMGRLVLQMSINGKLYIFGLFWMSSWAAGVFSRLLVLMVLPFGAPFGRRSLMEASKSKHCPEPLARVHLIENQNHRLPRRRTQLTPIDILGGTSWQLPFLLCKLARFSLCE